MTRGKAHLPPQIMRDIILWTDYHNAMNSAGLGDQYTDRPHIDEISKRRTHRMRWIATMYHRFQREADDVDVTAIVMILAFVGVGFVVNLIACLIP